MTLADGTTQELPGGPVVPGTSVASAGTPATPAVPASTEMVTDADTGFNGDGYGLGVSFAVNDGLTLRAAVDSEDNGNGHDDTDRIALSGQASFGSVWANLGWYEEETGDADWSLVQFWIGTAVGEKTSVMLGYGTRENGWNDTEPSKLALGVYHNMGGGFRLWYEGYSADPDTDADSTTAHYLGMRYDF